MNSDRQTTTLSFFFFLKFNFVNENEFFEFDRLPFMGKKDLRNALRKPLRNTLRKPLRNPLKNTIRNPIRNPKEPYRDPERCDLLTHYMIGNCVYV